MIDELKKLQQLNKLQEKKIKQLEALVEKDFLTGIYNRQGFVNQVEKFLKQSKFLSPIERRKSFFIKNFSIVFIDLDNIKIINDSFGHKARDYVLKRVVKFFQKSNRKTDILVRWGGDEFIITFLNLDQKKVFEIAEGIRKKLANLKIIFKNNKIKITASFGVVCHLSKKYNQKIYSLYDLIDEADKIMYMAKKDFKKNRVISI